MLPIDEHAKSYGQLILFRVSSGKIIWADVGRWRPAESEDEASLWWSDFTDDEICPTHYLPASWVENAAKMREALSLMVSSFDAGMLPNKNILEDARKVLAAVKRSPNQEPEPSEGERVEKVAAVIERELMIDEGLLADPATLRKIKSQRIARAALKAMEG